LTEWLRTFQSEKTRAFFC